MDDIASNLHALQSELADLKVEERVLSKELIELNKYFKDNGIDPENLDKAISKLTKKAEKAEAKLKTRIKELSDAVKNI